MTELQGLLKYLDSGKEDESEEECDLFILLSLYPHFTARWCYALSEKLAKPLVLPNHII